MKAIATGWFDDREVFDKDISYMKELEIKLAKDDDKKRSKKRRMLPYQSSLKRKRLLQKRKLSGKGRKNLWRKHIK